MSSVWTVCSATPACRSASSPRTSRSTSSTRPRQRTRAISVSRFPPCVAWRAARSSPPWTCSCRIRASSRPIRRSMSVYRPCSRNHAKPRTRYRKNWPNRSSAPFTNSSRASRRPTRTLAERSLASISANTRSWSTTDCLRCSCGSSSCCSQKTRA